jgi:phosphoadenosine phosphosulfate reductase
LQTLLSPGEIDDLNLRFERAEPADILRWTFEQSGFERIAIASAFQAEGTAVIHMATAIRPDVPILFLETGFQFAETLAFKAQLIEQLQLNVVDLVGEYTVEQQAARFGDHLYERNPERCCDINKVQPMLHALRELDAWITAYRRDSSPTRGSAPIIDRYDLEPGRSMVKINPMAAWTRRQVWQYLRDQRLPHNPLYDLGYSSIGCAPCTRMRFEGEAERAGRWAGLSKWECGIQSTDDDALRSGAEPAVLGP